jgi:putative ABC transport system permease protein
MYFSTFILKNLTRRPVRTILTVLGLSVAVGSMIALLGISDNVERSLSESFTRRGVDLVAMEKGKTDQLSSDLHEDVVRLARKIDGVERVDAALITLTDITTSGGQSIPVLSLGWPPENFGYEDLKILSGRQLSGGDTRKAMLGKQLAENLRKGVGDAVELQAESFEVAGVFESFNVYDNGSVIIPLADAQRLAARPRRITGFSVQVRKSSENPRADVEAVRRKIEELPDLDPETKRPYRISALPVKDYVESSSHIKLLRALVWMVSVIALAIGVISMANTMVMAVLERTQEIGILRAVGWSRGRIMKMVLGEALVLAVAAAAVGTLGAFAATHALAATPKVSGFIEPGISARVVAQGFGLTALIGVLGGAYPAYRAASLLPTEAIRHD